MNSKIKKSLHLEEVNKTYFEHLRFAWSVAFVLFIHGLLPFVWETKATEMIENSKKHCK